MKTPPKGFSSWINFYDYLQEEKPELLKAKTIIFATPNEKELFGTKVQKISIASIQRYCWLEITDDRLTIDEVHQLRLLYEEHNEVLRDKIQKFLKKSAKLSKL